MPGRCRVLALVLRAAQGEPAPVVGGRGRVGVATGAEGVGGATVVQVVDDVDAAVRLLREQVVEGDIVLVKASRSSGLETVARALTEVTP